MKACNGHAEIFTGSDSTNTPRPPPEGDDSKSGRHIYKEEAEGLGGVLKVRDFLFLYISLVNSFLRFHHFVGSHRKKV